jgi:hypothetical protein
LRGGAALCDFTLLGDEESAGHRLFQLAGFLAHLDGSAEDGNFDVAGFVDGVGDAGKLPSNDGDHGDEAQNNDADD